METRDDGNSRDVLLEAQHVSGGAQLLGAGGPARQQACDGGEVAAGEELVPVDFNCSTYTAHSSFGVFAAGYV